MIIIKNNDYYNREYTNDIEEYTFNSTVIEKDSIDINDLSNQSELDIQLSVDLLRKSKLQLRIPLDI